MHALATSPSILLYSFGVQDNIIVSNDVIFYINKYGGTTFWNSLDICFGNKFWRCISKHASFDAIYFVEVIISIWKFIIFETIDVNLLKAQKIRWRQIIFFLYIFLFIYFIYIYCADLTICIYNFHHVHIFWSCGSLSL